MAKTLVVAELLEGAVRKTSLSGVTMARQVGGDFDIILVGEGASGAAGELAAFGAGKIITCDIAGGYVCEKHAATVAAAAADYEVILSCASSYGKDLLPRVAAKLGAGVASDISGISADGGQLTLRRPMYAGNVSGTLTIDTDKKVITGRQTEFEAAEPSGGASATEAMEPVADAAADRIEFVSLEVVKSERPDLSEADVVVSGGRSLKSAENFTNIMEPLVDGLGAAMGASRAACDAGYVAADLQVGQTGKVVAPELYIAVGISGAIQHLAGMKGSKCIVAINKDKEAPIAQVADYFLVADLFDAVPALTAEIAKVKAAG